MSPDTSRSRLIREAKTLMLAKGYSGTTVDEICRAAAVSKGSFYHFFHSKEQLGLTVLDEYFSSTLQPLMNGPFVEIDDPIQRALALIEYAETISADIWAEGCLLGSFAVDLAETSTKVRQQVSSRFLRLERELAQIFKAAGLGKAGDATATPEELAGHFIAAIEGSIVLARAHNDTKRIARTIRDFGRYIKLLIS
jgi:TetR/AcrR family transcriptional repressor of nem operon